MAVTIEDFKNNICMLNKYTKWYFKIIDYAIQRNTKKTDGIYTESHHIVPKSISGDTRTSGVRVNLTAREHFVCHLLLSKMLIGFYKRQMQFALHRMLHGNNQLYCKSARLYESIKIQHSEASAERSNKYWNSISSEQRTTMRSGPNNGRYGKEVSQETRSKISNSNKGKLSKEKHPLWGKGHSEQTKAKMSIEAKQSAKSVGPSNPNYGKVGAAAGKKWYHNPETQETKYFIPGTQPDDFVLGRK